MKTPTAKAMAMTPSSTGDMARAMSMKNRNDSPRVPRLPAIAHSDADFADASAKSELIHHMAFRTASKNAAQPRRVIHIENVVSPD
jgi:hypothetical protein